jgi:serine/threonine-protein kinase RsbT
MDLCSQPITQAMTTDEEHEPAKLTTDIRQTTDIVLARSFVRKVAGKVGFGLADQTRLATAVSELARNILQYAGEGFCEIADASDKNEIRLRIVIGDHGPGIVDIDKAMKDGFSTSGGLGAGLPGTRRLMDDFSIDSQPGLTRITIALARKRS